VLLLCCRLLWLCLTWSLIALFCLITSSLKVPLICVLRFRMCFATSNSFLRLFMTSILWLSFFIYSRSFSCHNYCLCLSRSSCCFLPLLILSMNFLSFYSLVCMIYKARVRVSIIFFLILDSSLRRRLTLFFIFSLLTIIFCLSIFDLSRSSDPKSRDIETPILKILCKLDNMETYLLEL